MTTRKRRKSTRYPGTKTHGRGRKNRTRGSGNRGGVGMSGTGKRGDQKKTLVIHWYGNAYFGKARRGDGTREKKKTPSLSIQSIISQLPRLMREGSAKDQKGHYDINLGSYKIVGDNAHGVKLHITAKSASAGALRAVAQAGGTIVTSDSETEKA